MGRGQRGAALIADRRFAPGWGSTLAAAIGCSILIALGLWQIDRAGWKRDLIASVEAGLSAEPVSLPDRIADPSAWQYRPVFLEGRFDHAAALRLMSRTYEGRPGWHILTPLIRTDGASPVLVDRGWVPRDPADPRAGPVTEPDGDIRIQGIARMPPARGWMQPDNDLANAVVYWLDMQAIADALGRPDLAPIIVEAGQQGAGLPLGGRTRVTFRDDHLQYAAFWFTMAAVLAGFWVALGLRRGAQKD